MNVHKNARTTPRGREWLVSQAASGQSPKGVGDAVGVCPRTVRKWLKRHHDEGVAGLQDRSSRPKRLYRPTPQPVVERIEALRRQRLTGKAIAAETGVSPATVSRILRRLGLNKLSALEPSEPVRRYERKRPGELNETAAFIGCVKLSLSAARGRATQFGKHAFFRPIQRAPYLGIMSQRCQAAKCTRHRQSVITKRRPVCRTWSISWGKTKTPAIGRR
jgi:transposase